MELNRTRNELINQARNILLHEGKIRIATIQIKCGIGFVKAKEIFDALIEDGLGAVNCEGILTLE